MWPQWVCYDDHSDRFGRSHCRSAGDTRRHDGDATTMTDDTDHDEHDGERAVSLPLIDTFAALEAEIDAKADRIERLESELDRGYLDPDEGGAASVDGDDTDHADDADDAEPRTHEDWEPETDPLDDTGAATADGDHEGVTPSVDAAAEPDEAATASDESTESDPSAAAESEATDAADGSGLSPVRTASAAGETTEASGRDDESGAEADESFGVTMEASEDLTGGSLGSSTDSRAASERAETDDTDDTAGSADADSLPDPTADRGERLSLLVRRAELRDEDEVVETFVRGIDAFDEVTRGMLAHYREAGDAAPVDAHVAAGGSGERQYAYARNRTLRKAGVIEHDGAGRYSYALPELVVEAFDGNADGDTVTDAVDAIEAAADLD